MPFSTPGTIRNPRSPTITSPKAPVLLQEENSDAVGSKKSQVLSTLTLHRRQSGALWALCQDQGGQDRFHPSNRLCLSNRLEWHQEEWHPRWIDPKLVDFIFLLCSFSLFFWGEGGSLDFALSLLIIFSTSSSLWTWKYIKRGRGKKKK